VSCAAETIVLPFGGNIVLLGATVEFTANGGTHVWMDKNGNVSEQDLADGASVTPYTETQGVNHLVLRATNGTSSGEWDIYTNAVNSGGTLSCEASISASVGAISGLS
jgi:hypothetical protein